MIVNEWEFWDLGEETMISLCDKPLATVLRTLIQCEGQITCTHCMEKDFYGTSFKHPNRQCSVLFRVKLPKGIRSEFERLSGMKLTEPPQVQL